MVVTNPAIDQSLKDAWERIDELTSQEQVSPFEALPQNMAKKIQDGTVTLEEIAALLIKSPPDEPVLKGQLLLKKAELLRKDGRLEEALEHYDEVLRIHPNSHSTLAQRGLVLIELDRLDEGLLTLQSADQLLEKDQSINETFGGQSLSYLGPVYSGWSVAALLLGIASILQQNSIVFRTCVESYLLVLEKSQAAGLENWVAKPSLLEGAESLSPELRDPLEELMLAIRLLSIKDPFDRWREFTKEISKVWPEGLSAVDAIREQRDREWNQ